MAIDALDLATIRRRTGASVAEIDDDAVNAIYMSSSQGEESLNLTTYYVILDILGTLANLIDVSDPTLPSSARYSQRYTHIIDKLLPLWANINGISVTAATVTAGTLNLAIDTTADDLDNPNATWLYGS